MTILSLSSAPSVAAAGAISQSYDTASSDVIPGTLLSLTASGSGVVSPASEKTAANLVGIAAQAPTLELSSGGTNSLQVIVGGTAEALVSDANGTISVGDKIAISPLTGVGMKAVLPGEIIGTAQQSLNSVKTVVKQYVGTHNKTVSVRVGLILVTVNTVYYSAASSGTISTFVPPYLQGLANSLAGKPVSPLKVLLGTLTLLLGFFVVAVTLYSGVRSGVISIGRNPLAAKALRSGLVDVLIGALGVLIVTGVVASAIVLV